MIVVDTGAWFAAFVPNDTDHVVAEAWLETNAALLVTTDYIIDELLTLMKIRDEFQRALRVGTDFVPEEVAHLIWVHPDDVQQAWETFRRYQDKGWGFTDCVSRVVMQCLGIQVGVCV